MDDYNVNVLSETKNEYSARLLELISPAIIEGIKSIFNDAVKICQENDEEDKYLMTFQNYLTRVPKWNSTLIDTECQRIVNSSKCSYLEDLLTCVHITHLKLLTSVRVSQKQKKIDIDIPKISTFIHKIYINLARKIYSNVYLFEKDIMPLQYQKNMRECDILCRESILAVIRESIPVEKILRAYIDETVDEEIIEELIEKNVSKKEAEKMNEEIKERNEEREKKLEEESIDTNTSIVDTSKNNIEETNELDTINNIKENFQDTLKVLTEKLDESQKKLNTKLDNIDELESTVKEKEKEKEEEKTKNDRLKFNDDDSVLDMGTNKESIVSAPKTIERLDEIAKVNDAKRKAEEAEFDDEDDDDGPLKIHGDNINLQFSDIHDLDKSKELKPLPSLDVEVLS
tara:strand:+ start:818 stop:2020 length:1203 start_codon:yes stop_codon:yes gene_type:complete